MNQPGAMPPRSLPVLSKLIILFGGFYVQFGWLFFTFGAMFFLVFFAGSGGAYYLVSLKWHEVEGKITHVRLTDDNAQELTIAYQVDGKTYDTQLFVYGESHEAGQSFPLLYSAEYPDFAREKESHDARFSLVTLLILVFPITGLVFIYIGMRRNLKAMELVVNGIMTLGKFVSREMTNTRINDQPVYKYTFAFTGDDGETYQVSGNTHKGYLVEGEPEERILYAPGDPAYAEVYDLIPYAPLMREDGSLQPVSPFRAVVLILPLITLLLLLWLMA